MITTDSYCLFIGHYSWLFRRKSQVENGVCGEVEFAAKEALLPLQ
ncbi:hypothetical protein PALB_36030 [Pseudoalteromonas luteoviolacea B = ATCC 29581]|nr:hypothetical protein PALB_36030 [Pseudoalteromonas luteoviolacea B = ATCC 29581]